MTAPVLIVSGCSAVGKTTVSRLLVRSLEPCVHMPIDIILRLFDDPFPDAASPEGAHRYEVVGAAAAAASAQLALGGYTVILDSPMFAAGADGVAEICGRRGVEAHYAVLRSSLSTCLGRAKRRDPASPPDLDSFRSLHDHFVDLATRESHVIDASGPPEQVAATVLYRFRSGQLTLNQTGPGPG